MRQAAMSVDPAIYRAGLTAKLEQIEREIESYRATLALLEIERGRVKYLLNDYVRTVQRMDT
jgi:hypothetical protein